MFTVIEGETLNISLKTSGNPPQIKYKWKLPSTSSTHRVRTEGPKLILKNAQRMDRGNYSILAWNGHGNFNTTLHVFVDVRFPPRYVFLKCITSYHGFRSSLGIGIPKCSNTRAFWPNMIYFLGYTCLFLTPKNIKSFDA